jgi:hypothetical protein
MKSYFMGHAKIRKDIKNKTNHFLLLQIILLLQIFNLTHPSEVKREVKRDGNG